MKKILKGKTIGKPGRCGSGDGGKRLSDFRFTLFVFYESGEPALLFISRSVKAASVGALKTVIVQKTINKLISELFFNFFITIFL